MGRPGRPEPVYVPGGPCTDRHVTCGCILLLLLFRPLLLLS